MLIRLYVDSNSINDDEGATTMALVDGLASNKRLRTLYPYMEIRPSHPGGMRPFLRLFTIRQMVVISLSRTIKSRDLAQIVVNYR